MKGLCDHCLKWGPFPPNEVGRIYSTLGGRRKVKKVWGKGLKAQERSIRWGKIYLLSMKPWPAGKNALS
jgi:hypothetical protein